MAAFAEDLGGVSVNADMAFLDEAFCARCFITRNLKSFVYTVDETG